MSLTLLRPFLSVGTACLVEGFGLEGFAGTMASPPRALMDSCLKRHCGNLFLFGEMRPLLSLSAIFCAFGLLHPSTQSISQ